ncbi:hypothetical protein [Streptomyces sp. NBC_01506]|uniref:hypothetical protein n=1 Tax=Streptomyces sp. NBC_01506 TaxID=2903887 RepID=UPI00386B2B16
MATASRTPAVTAEPACEVYHRGEGWPSSRLWPLVLTPSEEALVVAGLAAVVRAGRRVER